MSGVFLKIVNMSIAAGWLVAVLVLLHGVFKKIPKFVMCILWGVVALRLVCPFTLQSKVSLIPSAETFSQDILSSGDATFHIETGFYALNSQLNEYWFDHYYEGVVVPANKTVDTVTVLSAVWLAGIAVMLVYAFVSWLKVRHKVREAAFSRDNIWVCDGLASPFILGVFRPRIYLPSDLGGTAQAHVIAHENAHLSRRDYLWKMFGFLLLAVYWFNPLMWLAYIMLCRDIEAACDEKVVSRMNMDGRADYSESLLKCSIQRRAVTACPLAFGETGVKARVKNVLNYKKPAFWVICASLVLCAVVAVCFLTDPLSARLRDVCNIDKDVFDKIDCITVTRGDDTRTYTNLTAVELAGQALKEIKTGKRPMPLSVCENFTEESHLNIYSGSSNIHITIGFNSTASQLRLIDADGMSAVYSVKNPEAVRNMLSQLEKFIYAESDYDTYVMQRPKASYSGMEGIIDVSPSFTLNKIDYTFTFYFSTLSSYFACGHYELTDDKLIMHTDDSYGFVYTFKIGDGVFVYDKAESYGLTTGANLEDGDVFYRSDFCAGPTVYIAIDRIEADIDGDGKKENCTLTWGPTSGIRSYYFISSRDGSLLCRDIFTEFYDGGSYDLKNLFFETGDDGTLYVCSGQYMMANGAKTVEHRFVVNFENGHVFLTDLENGNRLR